MWVNIANIFKNHNIFLNLLRINRTYSSSQQKIYVNHSSHSNVCITFKCIINFVSCSKYLGFEFLRKKNRFHFEFIFFFFALNRSLYHLFVIYIYLNDFSSFAASSVSWKIISTHQTYLSHAVNIRFTVSFITTLT